jgi:hypothetical protein
MRNHFVRQKIKKMHAVSVTPHERGMRGHWHRMQNMTPHAQWTKDLCGPGSL